jgi:hypothetical protein
MGLLRHGVRPVAAVWTAAAVSHGAPADVKPGVSAGSATPAAAAAGNTVSSSVAAGLPVGTPGPELASGATETSAVTRKAPPGYLYVLRHISKVTDSGVVGVDPGTLLALVSRGTVKSEVTDGAAEFQIENEYLTDDTDMAEMARRTDAQSQAVVAQLLLQRKAEMERQNREYTEKVESAQQRQVERDLELAKIAAANRAATSGTSEQKAMLGSSLDRGAYDQHYSRSYWWYRDRWGYRYYVDAYGHWVYY